WRPWRSAPLRSAPGRKLPWICPSILAPDRSPFAQSDPWLSPPMCAFDIAISPLAGSSVTPGCLQSEKSNSPARSNGMPSLLSLEASAWSKDPEIAGRFQLYSMKFTIDAWSLRLWSTVSGAAHGEISSVGSRGPKPHRPCSPPSGVPEVPHLPDGGRPLAFVFVFVRLSATVNDGFVTPL